MCSLNEPCNASTPIVTDLGAAFVASSGLAVVINQIADNVYLRSSSVLGVIRRLPGAMAAVRVIKPKIFAAGNFLNPSCERRNSVASNVHVRPP